MDPRDYPGSFDQPLVDGADDFAEDDEGQSYAVRPYAVTGGRTRAAGQEQLPLETLVQALTDVTVGLTPEKRRMVELTSEQYLSLAELSAHIKLPVGVVRVIVSDLAEEGKVRVHGIVGQQGVPSASLSVLESVLNGISAL